MFVNSVIWEFAFIWLVVNLLSAKSRIYTFLQCLKRKHIDLVLCGLSQPFVQKLSQRLKLKDKFGDYILWTRQILSSYSFWDEVSYCVLSLFLQVSQWNHHELINWLVTLEDRQKCWWSMFVRKFFNLEKHRIHFLLAITVRSKAAQVFHNCIY